MAEEARGLRDRLVAADHAAIAFMRRLGVTLLRVAVGLVFVWFGLLKVVGRSPVGDLVSSVAYWLPGEVVVRGLGVFEIIVGAGLVTGLFIRLTLLLFFAQMLGTFLVFVIRPDVAFQGGNPLLLTVEGEFVIKNLVLLSAGIVVGSTVPRLRRNRHLKEGLVEGVRPPERNVDDSDPG
jgi:putative oxidoreductase